MIASALRAFVSDDDLLAWVLAMAASWCYMMIGLAALIFSIKNL